MDALFLNALNGRDLGLGTDLFVSMHTGKLEPASQGDAEVTYRGYRRQKVARSDKSWQVANCTIRNLVDITFPEATGDDGEMVTYIGVGTAAKGAGTLLLCFRMPKPRRITRFSRPVIDAGDLMMTFESDGYDEDDED